MALVLKPLKGKTSIIWYPISNPNSQRLGSRPRKFIQTTTNTRLRAKKWSYNHIVFSNLNSQKLGSGPWEVYSIKHKHKTQGKGKILSHDDISNINSQKLGFEPRKYIGASTNTRLRAKEIY